MTVARLKYAVLFIGLLAPLSAHAEMGDPSPGMHPNAPIMIDSAPSSAVDVTPTGSIKVAPPCDARQHPGKKRVKCPPQP